jgi:hypothetical protein
MAGRAEVNPLFHGVLPGGIPDGHAHLRSVLSVAQGCCFIGRHHVAYANKTRVRRSGDATDRRRQNDAAQNTLHLLTPDDSLRSLPRLSAKNSSGQNLGCIHESPAYIGIEATLPFEPVREGPASGGEPTATPGRFTQ